jgi:uncharacterized protein YdaL
MMHQSSTTTRTRTRRAVAALVATAAFGAFPLGASAETPIGSGETLSRPLPSPPRPTAIRNTPPRPLPSCKALRTSPRLAKRRAICRVPRRIAGKRTMAIAPPTPGVVRAKTFGPSGLKKTLVLYSSTGAYAWLGEMYAYGAGNLATHFGQVTTMPAVDYTAGRIANFDAVIVIGSTYDEAMTADLVKDLRTTSKPIIWAGFNANQLSGAPGSDTAATFAAKYGWDPSTSYITADTIPTVTYKGRRLTRSIFNQGGVFGPHIVDATKVAVLATGQCMLDGAATPCSPIAQTGGSDIPWAIRSANLTFVSEIPLSYISERDRYLVFADLLFPALAPTTTPIRQAAVRLEDVTPLSDPATLRAFADYLASQNVPFSVAVVPNHVDPTGIASPTGLPVNVVLSQRPALVSALNYMRNKGGTIIQHGTTHQYGTVANPYNGASVDDFEFFRALCSTTLAPPLTFVDCASSPDTWVQLLGPVAEDSQSWAAGRVSRGRNLFANAYMAAPAIFEFPHYAGSINSYKAVRQYYATRYERTLNFGGQLLPGADSSRFYGQFFPYATWDVWGSKVLPENIGNYEPEPFNNHPAVLPADILERASANLVVTQSTASFFFHPVFDLSALKEIVTGIKAQGYTFVSPAKLK